jgi:hypothetical protein
VLRAEVPAAQATALLRTLPRPTSRSAARTTRWVVPAGFGLRPASRPAPGTVCLPGAERLSVVRPVLRYATVVRLYAPAGAEGEPAAVAWEFRLPGMRLVVMLSPDAYRGFSGEGGVLDDLATGAEEDLLSRLAAWGAKMTVAELARQAALPPDRARRADAAGSVRPYRLRPGGGCVLLPGTALVCGRRGGVQPEAARGAPSSPASTARLAGTPHARPRWRLPRRRPSSTRTWQCSRTVRPAAGCRRAVHRRAPRGTRAAAGTRARGDRRRGRAGGRRGRGGRPGRGGVRARTGRAGPARLLRPGRARRCA